MVLLDWPEASIVWKNSHLALSNQPIPYSITDDHSPKVTIRDAVPRRNMGKDEDVVFECKARDANRICNLAQPRFPCIVELVFGFCRPAATDGPRVLIKILTG